MAGLQSRPVERLVPDDYHDFTDARRLELRHLDFRVAVGIAPERFGHDGHGLERMYLKRLLSVVHLVEPINAKHVSRPLGIRVAKAVGVCCPPTSGA
jgi:hypothetical protein